MTKEPGTEAGGRRDEGQTRRGRMIDEVRHTHETRVTGEVLRYRRNSHGIPRFNRLSVRLVSYFRHSSLHIISNRFNIYYL